METTNLGAVGISAGGVYNPETVYKKYKVVSANGGSYMYINSTPAAGKSLTDTSHWQQIAAIGGQDLVDAAVAARDAAQGYKDAAAASAAQLAAGTASPAGTYANLAALTSDDPDHSKIYITLDDGNWCYHNGAAWAAGGVYQAVSYPEVATARQGAASLADNLTNIKDTFNNGFITKTKPEIISASTLYKSHRLMLVATTPSYIGQHLDSVATSSSTNAMIYKLDIANVKRIKYPTFNTSSGYGSLMVDEDDVVIWVRSEAVLETGSLVEIEVPINAKYFILGISSTLSSMDWTFHFSTEVNNRLAYLEKENEVYEELKREEISSIPTYAPFALRAKGRVGSKAANSTVGAGASYTKQFDVTDYIQITYPVFNTTAGLGCVFVDDDDTIIWEHAEETFETGTYKTVNVPMGAKYFLFTHSTSLQSMSWTMVLYRRLSKTATKQILEDIYNDSDDPITPSMFGKTPYYLNLCAIKTEIRDNKIPYHSGYLFHKFNDDKTLWYGTNYDKIDKVGTVGFYPKDCVLAISPKDSRVIAATRGMDGPLYIWDGETTTTLFTDTSSPQPKGWLYNSGVDFIKTAGGIEYCIFAGYSSHYDGSLGGFNVWRGKHPYTAESDWEIVFFQNYNGDESPITTKISHFHQVVRDPWTNILYLFSGDTDSECFWWYSLDYGATWVLLTDFASTGFETQVLRACNSVFTKDKMYWAVDHGTSHCLNSVVRNETTGIIDMSTRVKIVDLPPGQATNSICYVESPNGIFMFDRIDIGYDSYYGDGLDVQFWDLQTEELKTLMHIDFVAPSWGGHRGKCYSNYTSGTEARPAMGFSADSPCLFDIAAKQPGVIGTVFYDIEGRVLRYLVG